MEIFKKKKKKKKLFSQRMPYIRRTFTVPRFTTSSQLFGIETYVSVYNCSCLYYRREQIDICGMT